MRRLGVRLGASIVRTSVNDDATLSPSASATGSRRRDGYRSTGYRCCPTGALLLLRRTRWSKGWRSLRLLLKLRLLQLLLVVIVLFLGRRRRRSHRHRDVLLLLLDVSRPVSSRNDNCCWITINAVWSGRRRHLTLLVMMMVMMVLVVSSYPSCSCCCCCLVVNISLLVVISCVLRLLRHVAIVGVIVLLL